MAEPTRCQELLLFIDSAGHPAEVRCQRLIVTAAGRKVEHIHHHRELDIPGCKQARVTWTRRP
jgi:hypothetical protein